MNILRVLVVASFCLSSLNLSAAVNVTRDSFGVPTLTGGDLASVSRTVGQVHAQDRLWQIFLQNIAANGRLSEYLGDSNPDYLKSDVFQRQTNPTDEEVAMEIRKYFTKNTLIAFENYVRGLNDWVDEVNANIALRPLELLGVLGTDPIPHFTLYDNLRSVRLFFQSFSPTQIPQFQLTNLAALQTFATSFGSTNGYAIFSDVDPTSRQVRSLVTMMENNNPTPGQPFQNFHSLFCKINKPKALIPYASADFEIINNISPEDINSISSQIKGIKDLHKKMSAAGGSSGQVIGPEKSASGYPMLRCGIQPNFNHPSDFYQVKVEDSFFKGNYFIVPGVPFGIGLYNTFGFNAQTGHLPTNDFLFEPITNVSSTRIEVIKVKGESDIVIEVQRSSSGGWVIANPVSIGMPTTMLTLRSAWIERQLQGLNIIGDLPYLHSVPEFYEKALTFKHSSDIIGFEGQCADCDGNFGAYQATTWTQLPPSYDRRLPQGIITLAPPNNLYRLSKSAQKPMLDINTPQGYYSGWNNLYKQFAEGSADTVSGIPLSRAYWLVNYFEQFDKITLEQLKDVSFEQAVANSVVAFKDSRPTAYADLFNPLFKERFFAAFPDSPTPNQQLALTLLANYDGRWFEGTKAQVAVTEDVSEAFILAQTWLLNVAATILNPKLTGTAFVVNPGSAGGPINALPSTNIAGASNDLAVYQGGLLARILGTASDNTLIYQGWLDSVDVDQVILDALDTAIANLGATRPWGEGLRPTYVFNNLALGPVQEILNFNASGCYFVAEFRPEGITNVSSVLPLGESGFVAPAPTTPPYTFGPHNFDQEPYFTQFDLIPN